MDWTRHPFWKVLIILEGKGRLETRKQHWFLGRDLQIIVPPGLTHRICDEPGKPLSIYVICIGAPGLQAELSTLLAHDRPRFLKGHDLAAASRQVVRELRFEEVRSEPGSNLVRTGLASLYIARSVRQTSDRGGAAVAATSATERVAVALETVRTRFYEQQDIESAASRAGTSRRRFTQLVRKLTGRSWTEIVRDLRLNHAEGLLRTTTHPVTAVAFECGFEELSTFHRAFRRRTGTSPERWRQAERDDFATSRK
jgi:AraC family L-rhamnose operon regulatory protein RhaS